MIALDAWIRSASGHLHVRRWAADAKPVPGIPIVLLHDSLGCTELWRSFPADLARATGHGRGAGHHLVAEAVAFLQQQDFLTRGLQGLRGRAAGRSRCSARSGWGIA